jgi:hypothetical protein
MQLIHLTIYGAGLRYTAGFNSPEDISQIQDMLGLHLRSLTLVMEPRLSADAIGVIVWPTRQCEHKHARRIIVIMPAMNKRWAKFWYICEAECRIYCEGYVFRWAAMPGPQVGAIWEIRGKHENVEPLDWVNVIRLLQGMETTDDYAERDAYLNWLGYE